MDAWNNSLSFFIADVMGHGVSAALYMALIRFLSEHLTERYYSRPHRFLERLNETLLKDMPLSFVTALYGYMEPDGQEGIDLRIANAGHTTTN